MKAKEKPFQSCKKIETIKPLIIEKVMIGIHNGAICLMYRKNIIQPLNTELWFVNL
jgi:hypothetical protein